jgi:nitrogenase subunit NifH
LFWAVVVFDIVMDVVGRVVCGGVVAEERERERELSERREVLVR